MSDCFVRVSLHDKDVGEIVVCLGIGWFELQGFLVGTDCLAQFVLHHKDITEVVIGVCLVRIVMNGIANPGNRFIEFSLSGQGHSEIVERVVISGPEFDGL